MALRPRHLDCVLGMHSAGREHGDSVNAGRREHGVDRSEGRHTVLGAEGLGAIALNVAHGGQAGTGNLPRAQQLGMALGDPAAADDGEIDHARPMPM